MTPGLTSFTVLNWNGLDDTLLCLDSIRKQTIDNYEIIVVDNGSAEEQKIVLRGIKDITLIDLPENTGFTGGQIAAFEKANGEFLALINNDAVIAPDWAAEALKSFQGHPKVAAVGGKAFLWDINKKQSPFSEENSFYSYQVVNLISGHTRTLTYGENEVAIDSVSGSGVMINRKAINKVGYFDNTFFAYYEETDLFARFKRAGFQVLYNPRMHTWHKIAQSTKSKPNFYLYHMHRNRFMFAVKNYDTRYLISFLRHYTKEWLKASAILMTRGSSNAIEEKNLVKAGLWNAAHLSATFIKRRAVIKLGRSYSDKLLQDTAESISVVITCYNYAKYVSAAIESVLNQTLKPAEIIVINDGSTDDSLAIINKFGDKITVVDQNNRGIIKTKNIGLGMAKSDWVVFLDADDEMRPNFLESLYSAARQSNADIVYSAMQFFGHEDGVFWSRPYSRYSLLKGNYITNSSLMRRDAVVAVDGYKEAMHFGFEDWELYISLAENNKKFKYVREPLLLYRRHPGTSRDKEAKKKLKLAKRVIKSLHPRLFSMKYELRDYAHGVLLFTRHRSPLQLIKDLRYIAVTRLDSIGEKSFTVNKIMGFGRIIWSGDFKVLLSKIGLNIRRIKRRLF